MHERTGAEGTVSTVTLYHGDCLEVMRALPDASVDAVVTDPPYELTFTSVSATTPAFDKLRVSNWTFSHAWVTEMARLLKHGGAWYVFMNDEGWSSLRATAIQCGLRPCTRLVWIKTNPMPALPAKNYRNSTELAMYGTKGKKTAYFAKRTQQELLAHFYHPIVGGHERTPHPTQKPLTPLQFWVETSCPPDGVVLDPFMGSGTTGVACVNTGRAFIGIEKSPVPSKPIHPKDNPDYFGPPDHRLA